MNAIQNFLFSAAALVVVLGLLIVVHEFGHYIAGRLQGFAIEAFSVGFGPKIWEYKGRYNLFQIRWLPLGGYVKFPGESGDPSEETNFDGPGENFATKKRWQRFIVLVMGASFNLLLAYGIFVGLATVGWDESVTRDLAPVVGIVDPSLPAYKAGVRKGDLLLSIDGRELHNWNEATEAIAINQKPYELKVKRDKKILSFNVVPKVFTYLHHPFVEIGVFPQLPAVVGGVYPGSPAHVAGIKPGDRILSVSGHPTIYWGEISRRVTLNPMERKRFVIERDGRRLELDLTPKWNKEAKRYLVGVAPQDVVTVRYPFPANMVKAWSYCLDQSTLAFRTIGKLVERKIGMGALSGPVSIAYISGIAARAGFYVFLRFFAIISLQLAIFNLLPIPGLDGGHIFVLLIESIARRDLPALVKERIIFVGFALLILLFIVITFMDVTRFFH